MAEFNKIVFHGALADKYGKEHMCSKSTCKTLRDSMRLIVANFPKLRQDLKKWAVEVYTGENKEKLWMNPETMSLLPHKDKVYHIVPVIEAHKSNGIKGLIQVVIGVVLIVAGVLTGGYGLYLVPVGIGMIFGGVSTMLTPMPHTPDYSGGESANNRPSFMFKGAVNTMEQGNPVPVVYGEVVTGSTLIGVSLNTEDYVYS